MRAKRTLKDKILTPYLHLFEDSDIQIEFLYGTRDSGKTKAGSQLVVYEHSKIGADFKCILIRKIKDTIKDSIFENVKGIIEEWKLDDYYDSSKNPMEIRSRINNGIFLCRGLDESGKLKSLMNPTTALVEEADQITQDDLTMLLTTMRHNKIKVKLILMFNPEIPKGVKSKEDWWLYKDWFSHTDEKSFTHTKIISYFENGEEKQFSIKYRATHTTFEDNPYCTPERKAFYYDLRNTNPEKYLPYAKGEWGVKEIKSPAIHNFDKSRHVGKAEYNQVFPLIFAVDFNTMPLACTVWQEYKVGNEHKIRCIREIALENAKTQDLINFIQRNYTPMELSRAFFTGDATGRTETTANLSNWLQIDNHFRLGKRLHLPNVNPHVLTSLEHCDFVLHRHKDLIIDESCHHLIFELEYTEKDDKGLVKKSRTKAEQKADFLDTMRYMFNYYFLIRKDITQNAIYYNL